MIFDKLSSFDDAYKKLQKTFDTNLDYTTTNNVIKGKDALCEFLSVALLDCFTQYDIGIYASKILSNKEYINFFKDAHTKKDFDNFVGNLNKSLKN